MDFFQMSQNVLIKQLLLYYLKLDGNKQDLCNLLLLNSMKFEFKLINGYGVSFL